MADIAIEFADDQVHEDDRDAIELARRLVGLLRPAERHQRPAADPVPGPQQPAA